MASLLLVLLACSGTDTDLPPTPVPVDSDSDADTDPDAPWSAADCAGLNPNSDYSSQLDTWDAHTDPADPHLGDLVLTGSSSIRRWEHAQRDLAAWGPIQRGFGGAWLRDVAGWADRLVLAHEPRAVVVYAGTNDLTDGAPPTDVLKSWRCLVHTVLEADPDTHVVFVPVTPNPARWGGWPTAEAFNADVEALTSHPNLHYADVATPFLALGAPPPEHLFVSDQLHLSEDGYALWTPPILDALAAIPPRDPPPFSAPAEPFYVRIDFGPTNPEDGAPAPDTDAFGNRWNAWHGNDGDAQILAGDMLQGLLTTQGDETGIDAVVAGGFKTNGYANGGLTSPPAGLQTLAVPEATGDFFWTGDADDPGSVTLTGLDPARRWTVRLFAARDDAEVRVTRYTVTGATTASVELQTSGPGAGSGNTNDGSVAVLTGLEPDPWGQLHIDVAIAQGAFAYLSLLELEAEL